MLNRALRAAFLDGSLYKQIGDEPEEVFYALGIVVLAGLALGLGLQTQPPVNLEGAPTWMIIAFAVQTRLMGWFLWVGVVYLVGTKLLKGRAGFRQILRSLGITFGPGVLAIFAGIPVVGIYLLSLSILWLFPASLVAIRETQQFDWVRALICNILGWILGIIGLQVLFLPIAPPAG